jgi:hypothetical protein
MESTNRGYARVVEGGSENVVGVQRACSLIAETCRFRVEDGGYGGKIDEGGAFVGKEDELNCQQVSYAVLMRKERVGCW